MFYAKVGKPMIERKKDVKPMCIYDYSVLRQQVVDDITGYDGELEHEQLM